MIDFLITNTAVRIALLIVLFGGVVFVAIKIINMIISRVETKSQIKAIAASGNSATAGRLQGTGKSDRWQKLAEQIESSGLNLADSKSDKLAEKMRAAGFTSPAAPKIFTLIRLLLTLGLPTLYVLLSASGSEPMSFFKLYLVGSGVALVGLYVPNLFVQARADRRREAIIDGFPDCLDLMLVCVEAGLGLEAAMDRVGREMVDGHPLIAALLSNVTLQLRAGAQRDESLRQMGEQSGVDEIRSFATLLIQSDKLGTSISDSLRVYALEMREKRRMRAEEKAYRLPVLISIPLVVCMLPTMIGVLMLPGAVRIVREMIPALTGG